MSSKRQLFYNILHKRPIILDGATGSELVKFGLPTGASPELWVLKNPTILQNLQEKYLSSGSDIVLTCTFGSNKVKLKDHCLDKDFLEINRELVSISRSVVHGDKLLFGDLGPTGRLIEPFGDFSFLETVAVYKSQVSALLSAGVDGFFIETMMDIQEARAALIAVKSLTDLPVIASVTFEKTGKTLAGNTPEAVATTLQSLGADALGCNCSTGPHEMLPIVKSLLSYSSIPVMVKPNAGMPCIIDNKTQYNMESSAFMESILEFIDLGVRIVGGCCGTSPDFISAISNNISQHSFPSYKSISKSSSLVSSHRQVIDFSPEDGLSRELIVIGERINPTGKKTFQQELLSGDFSSVSKFADEQINAGAHMLDLNLGLGGIDECQAMLESLQLLSPSTNIPLCIDTVDARTMESALSIYPGRALVNSISGEKDRLENILPIAARFGSMLIVLPVAEGYIPETLSDRIAVTKDILSAIEQYGYDRSDLIIDGLAMTVSANPSAARVTLDFISYCTHELEIRTILGISNVSFGMPARNILNPVFLSMAMSSGLSSVIANPSSKLLMETKLAADALLNRSQGVSRFISYFKQPSSTSPTSSTATTTVAYPSTVIPEVCLEEQAASSILKGDIKNAASNALKVLDTGVKAEYLVNNFLIPAIIKAGDLYERQEYYLPQLMLAGEAMKRVMKALEPALKEERAGKNLSIKGKIIIATVKGDVHDIGKNLVGMMLQNHGFEVIDLGKDVSVEEIISSAEKFKPDIIGLSALMTTTLSSMQSTICAARSAGVTAKFIIGGAATTEDFAQKIGADGYSEDAVQAVRLAERLLGIKD